MAWTRPNNKINLRYVALGDTATPVASGSGHQTSISADAEVAALLPKRFKGGIDVASGVYAPMEMLVNGHRDTPVGGQAFSRLVAIRIPG